MKRLIVILAILALALPVLAHDPAQESAEAIADLKARQDMTESHNQTQGHTINELFRIIDDLRARVDALQGAVNGQSAAIDDLYRLADEAAGSDESPTE